MRTSELAALRSAVANVQAEPEPTEVPEYLSDDEARQIKALFSTRDEAHTAYTAMVDKAATEQRDLTPDELVFQGRYEAAIERAEDDIRSIDARAKKAHNDAAAAQARNGLGIGTFGAGFAGGNAKVTFEHRTYERRNGVSFVQDVCAVSFGPGVLGDRYFRALERIQRHGLENHVEALEAEGKGAVRSKAQEYFLRQMVEARNDRKAPVFGRGTSPDGLTSYRALSTTAGAGGEFVPPMYLTEQWLPFARPGRVVADACHTVPLPDGTMSINIPKVTSGTSVATQGTQNTNVSDTDLQTAFVTIPVVTKSGGQVVSLQELERSPIAFDEAVFKDLFLALAQSVDFAVVAGNGSNGDVTGILYTANINTVTWTQASPTVKGLYGQIEQAKVDIHNARFLPATHAFMTPSRYGWIEQSFDTNGRPLVVPQPNGPWNALQASAGDDVAQGVVGSNLLGLATFQDANIPSNLGSGTNQDIVIVSEMDDNWLMESPVVTRTLPQTYGAQLSVLFQLYEYMAFTAARYPVANSVITGTGLTPPSYNS